MGTEEYLLQKANKEGIETGLELGIEQGIEKSKLAFVKSLLADTDFDVEKIASLANVTIEFVQRIKTSAV